MKEKKKIFALIPARGGSKGLLKKNIRPLNGKPLIAWTIEQAQNSRYIDRIIVSTDNNEIAEVARQYDAEVPFLRPSALAADEAKAIAVVLHALHWLENNGGSCDLLLLLQPTSPLRAAEDIDNAIDTLFMKKAQAIVSVCENEHHHYWSNVLLPDACIKDFIRQEIIGKNRQLLPRSYRLNGAIYVAYVDYLIKHKNFFGKATYAYIMPAERSVDIDTQLDFDWAEYLMKKHKSK